jgi:hypothetical protein
VANWNTSRIISVLLIRLIRLKVKLALFLEHFNLARYVLSSHVLGWTLKEIAFVKLGFLDFLKRVLFLFETSGDEFFGETFVNPIVN